METKRWQRIQEILNGAEDVTLEERPAYLRTACGDDEEMYRELVSFFAFEEGSAEVLENAFQSPGGRAQSLPASATSDRNIGRRVGHYRIQRLLGRGGMGAVYLAVREDDFRQQVALKLVGPGMHSGQILERFLTERQILAHLEHPSIARVLDGGTTDDELPYFVMEYVDGVPIDEYCEAHGLSVAKRLELFRQVCSAVHAAHQSLVVHRDLKPSNILISPDGTPKLLDFGIAKILTPTAETEDASGPGLSSSVLTVAGPQPMTPNYASPEQVLDDVITTASDVYALGVLLYRLLTLEAPYEVTTSGVAELMRLICHEEPQKPSAAVRQQVVHAKTGEGLGKHALRRLERRLKGDLDAIVMKAMRKEPGQRYNSAEQFADDIERHLRGSPVRARQGTWIYLTSRYVRRHRVGLAFGFLSFVFAISSTFLWRQAVEERAQVEKERARVEQERNRSQAVVGFLESLFDAADPDATQGREVTVREILDQGRDQITEGLEEDPETQVYLLRSLGIVYNKLGLYEESRELKERALELRMEFGPEDHPELATDLVNLGMLGFDQGDYESAESYFRAALEMRRRLGQSDEEIVLTLYNLASALRQQGALAEAEEAFQETLAIRSRLFGAESREVAVVLHALGGLYHESGELGKAEPFLRRALNLYLKVLQDEEHTSVAGALNSLGRVLDAQGHYQEARETLVRALEIRKKRLGEEHDKVADTRRNLAAVLLASGEIETAEDLIRPALAVHRSSLSEGSWKLAESECVFGWYLVKTKRYEEAEEYLTESLRVIREAKNEESIYTENAARRLIELYEAWERPELAEQYRHLLKKR